MKQFLKHTARVLGFALGLIVILIAVSFVMKPKDNTERAGVLSERAYGFLAEPENSLDALFFGDSEGYRAFIPLQMWDEYGITSYVCNTSSQQLYLTEKMLSQALENQSPKYVFLETNALYRYAPYSDILMDRFSNLLPVLRYHDHWKHFSLRDFSPKIDYTHIEPFKGYAFRDEIEAVPEEKLDHMRPDSGEAKISRRSLNLLRRIARICREHDAELILISTPSTVNWNMRRHNRVQKLADKLGATYIDMNLLADEIPIDWSVDSYDAGDHLNYTGAVKATAYLGKYLSEAGLPDRRSDETLAAEWNENLEEFRKFLKEKGFEMN